MSNLKVIEEGRRAREIWAKRLGFQIRTLPLNPDGTRPKPKAEVAETVKATEAKPEVKATPAKPAKPAKPEVKAKAANVVIAQQG